MLKNSTKLEDEDTQRELESFHRLLNGYDDPSFEDQETFLQTQILKEHIINIGEQLPGNNENEKEENVIEKINYLREEISSQAGKLLIQEEIIQKLQHIKNSQEIELIEMTRLCPKNRDRLAHSNDDELFFDISVVVEDVDADIYLIRVLFSADVSVTFLYNEKKNTFELQSTKPVHDALQDFKSMVLLTNDIVGFLYIFRKNLLKT